MSDDTNHFSFKTPSGNEISCRGDSQFVERIVAALKPIIARYESVAAEEKKPYTSPKFYSLRKEQLIP
jgi:hypothetical protein